MTNEEQNVLRAMLREEVNAAVYASEQRLGERLGRVEDRLDRVDGRLDRVEGRLGGLEGDLAEVKGDLTKMKGDLAQVVSILDEVTIQINDLQASQRALETKVEENSASLKRDMQKLTYTVKASADHFTDAIEGIILRLNMHKDTPIDQAHPDSAA